eukprot:8826123-Ditylum_brightwellii.AAC.1
MEGVALEYYPDEKNNGNEPVIKGEFNSFLFDDSDQNAATTAAHMSKLIKYLIEKKLIQQSQSTIMEETDGCAKQYRRASAINLL